MGKKRNTTTNNGSKKERECWTPAMDEALLDAFVHQHNIGNRVSGSFTSHAYDNILGELREKFDKPLDKEKVKNRIKTIKANFTGCYDLFKNGLSGFAWNPITKMWSAEPEVWEKLIEAKPEARDWMNKPIPNYYKLLELYGPDRASGDLSETAAELRRRQANSANSVRENFATIDEIDDLVAQNEVTLESNIAGDDDDLMTSPESRSRAPSQAANSSKSKRRKASKDDEVELITAALSEVAAAMREASSTYERIHLHGPISEGELVGLLRDIGIEPHLLGTSYLYLIKNPDMLRALIGYPMEMRKELLLEMICGPSFPSTS